MSFDSDCRSGARPGANPLRGQKRHEIVDIWHLTRVSYHSSFIISIAIHPRHRHRHHRCRHHHHHHHVSCVLSSRLLPRAFFHATLSSSVFYPCASAVSFFEAKLVFLQSLCSVIWTILQTLQYSDSVVQCSWNLAWATVLGHVAWRLFIGTLLGNLFLGALLGNLFLGA